ncbi:hypothetical protein F2Q68_00039095 [Brassica cretica]|uniref:Uncharacterized protein n=1 Tax=Brassica cretica TaxID=69181 RepID=A0A8S9MHS5_BRACR|nr:hypothetical protein F2Q68_00039095 [Brassica cretica]
MLNAMKSRRILTSDPVPEHRSNHSITDLRDKLNANTRDLRVLLNRSTSTDLHRQLERPKMHNSSSVPKKKGRLVGLGRRTRSVPPSSAPPPFVDPEVLTAQLKDKDDRISLLETQMAAQQAGYEAQRRLNQQMMEMMQRMYPNEVFPNMPDP